MQIFAERFPSLTSRLKEVPDGLIQSASTEDGSYCYVKQLENGQWQTLSLTERPLDAASKAISSAEARLTAGLGPVVVVGLNPGYVLDIIYQHFEKEHYQKHIPRRIYVIIDSIECLYGWLQKTDRREILKHDEIEFYWHEDVEEIVELCQADETRSHLFMPISTYPEPKTSARMEPLARFFITRQEQEKKLFRQNRKYYDSISDDELNKIMSGQGSRKPRMLIPSHCSSTVVQYSVRDTAASFQKEGWEVRIMHMKTDLSRWRVNKNINDFKPDVYLLVNHLRTENLHFYPDNMMFVTWVQDTVSCINNSEVAKQWNEHVNGKEKQRDRVIGYVNQIKSYGYREDRLEECPMIVNQEIFNPSDLTPEEVKKYSCDVCFASNRSMPTALVARELSEKLGKFGFDENLMKQIHDQLWEYYRAEHSCTSYGELETKICQIPQVNTIFKRLIIKNDHDFVIQRLFWELNDIIYRHVILEWIDEVGDVKLHLYGRGWEAHPRFGKYARGVLEHGTELSKAYQAAMYCLHLNSMEAEHQRLWEILSCDAQPLSRKNETKELLSPALQKSFLKIISDSEAPLTTDEYDELFNWCLASFLVTRNAKNLHRPDIIREINLRFSSKISLTIGNILCNNANLWLSTKEELYNALHLSGEASTTSYKSVHKFGLLRVQDTIQKTLQESFGAFYTKTNHLLDNALTNLSELSNLLIKGNDNNAIIMQSKVFQSDALNNFIELLTSDNDCDKVKYLACMPINTLKQMIILLAKWQQYDKAAALIKIVYEKDETCQNLFMMISKTALGDGQFPAVIDLANKDYELNRLSGNEAITLACWLLYNKQEAKAKVIFNEYSHKWFFTREHVNILPLLLHFRGEAECLEAAKQFEELPNLNGVYSGIAYSYMIMRQHDKALEYFRINIESDSYNEFHKLMYCFLLTKMGNNKEATAFLEKINNELLLNSVGILVDLAVLLYENGLKEKAAIIAALVRDSRNLNCSLFDWTLSLEQQQMSKFRHFFSKES